MEAIRGMVRIFSGVAHCKLYDMARFLCLLFELPLQGVYLTIFDCAINGYS